MTVDRLVNVIVVLLVYGCSTLPCTCNHAEQPTRFSLFRVRRVSVWFVGVMARVIATV